jgi:hypothetical protein
MGSWGWLPLAGFVPFPCKPLAAVAILHTLFTRDVK